MDCLLNIVDIYLTAGLVNGFPDAIDQGLAVYLAHSVILHILGADTIISWTVFILGRDKYYSQWRWLEMDENIFVLIP